MPSTEPISPSVDSVGLLALGSVPRSTTATGSSGGAPARDQLRRDPRQRLDAHVEDQRARERGQRGPIQSGLRLVGVLVAGHERDAGRQLAVRDRDARVGGRRDPRGDPGHDLVRDAGRAQHERLLAAAPEHERVAALEPHHGPPAGPVLDQQPVDLLLRHLRPAALLAHVDELRGDAVEDARRDQPVIEDHVGGVDQLARPHGQQPRVPGPGADEEDRHGVARRNIKGSGPFRFASSSIAPAASSRFARPSAVDERSYRYSEPSGRPTNPRTPLAGGEDADRRVAGRLQSADDVALGVERGVGRRVVGAQRPPTPRGSPRGPGSRSRPGRRPARRRRRAAARPPRARRPSRSSPAAASTSTSTSPAARLASRVSTLPRISRHLEVRPHGEQLRAAAQRARPDPRALAHRRQRVLADEHVERLGPPRRRGDHRAGRQLARDVLGRVDREVDLAGQQRGLQRPDPARLVAARAVDVAGGRDLDQLDVAAEQPRDLTGLRQRQRAAAGA